MRNAIAGALALAATMAAASGASAAGNDKNHDRIPDRWERAHHLSLKVDQSKRDQDHDGLRNRDEWRDHTDPRDADSDSDGVVDGQDAQPTDPAPEDAPATHDDAPPATHEDTPSTGDDGDDAPPAGSDAPPAGSDAPATGSDAPTPAGDSALGHIVSYQQSPGFGGFLTIERPNGEHVTAYFGEKTDLECGDVVCTKDHLVAGTPVVSAEHGPNDRGYDVWTSVHLAAATQGSEG